MDFDILYVCMYEWMYLFIYLFEVKYVSHRVYK
jgi:hypothetical protein